MMLLWSLPAMGSSRVVVMTQEPVQLFMDGILIPTSVGTIRSAIPHVRPGLHTLAVHDLSGTLLHSEQINVPDGADVRVHWSAGQPFKVVGGGSSAPVGSAQNQGTLGAPIDHSADSPSGVATQTPVQSQSSGSLGRASGPRPSDLVQGNGLSSSRAGVLQRSVNSASPASVATGAAVSGVRAMTYGARSGTSVASANTSRQTIVQPNIVYGHVDLHKSGGGPIHIYDGGMLLAQMSEGEGHLRTKLEVGRRQIEIRSGLDNRILYRGDLNVDQQHNIQLAVSDTAPPRPTVRPWLWQAY